MFTLTYLHESVGVCDIRYNKAYWYLTVECIKRFKPNKDQFMLSHLHLNIFCKGFRCKEWELGLEWWSVVESTCLSCRGPGFSSQCPYVSSHWSQSSPKGCNILFSHAHGVYVYTYIQANIQICLKMHKDHSFGDYLFCLAQSTPKALKTKMTCVVRSWTR